MSAQLVRPGARLTPRQLIGRGLAVTVALQVCIAAFLTAHAAWRKRREQPQGFPHSTFEPVRVGQNTLQIFGYGRDLYDAMLADIDAATSSIYFETFIWKDDPVGQEFREHLLRKAAAGIDVYAIYDRFANLVVPRRFFRFPPGIHTLQYRAISRPWHLIDPRRYALSHRKLLAVDGAVAYVGGYNIGSLYATEWRDTHLRLEGPAASLAAQQFLGFWNAFARRDRRLQHRFRRGFDPFVNGHSNNALRLAFPIRDMYLSAVERADHHIYLTNAYFIPDRILRQALCDAAQRGVDVQVLLPWISNHTLADWMARGLFTECLRAGIRIFGYKTMIHAKTCTIDGEWTTIGTANMDRLSSVGNYEINIEVYSRELATQMEALFAADCKYATEITLDVRARRAWYAKASERLLAPFKIVM